MLTNTNKRRVESFIVAKASTALYNTAGDDDTLTNASTGAVRLADGQIGVLDGSGLGLNAIHTFLTSGDDVADSPVIYVAQGTGSSANPAANATYPLYIRPYERSGDINSNANIVVTKQAYVAPTYSIWTVGQPDGTAGEITALDNTEYQIRVVYRGRRPNEQYTTDGNASDVFYYTTPNYTALGTAQTRDHLLQNLAYNINKNAEILSINRTPFRGHSPVLALLIDSTGAAGDNIGGKGSGATQLAAGDVVPVINTSYGIKSVTMTADLVASIKAAAVAGSGDAIADTTWSILTIDTATAGTATGGVGDVLMLIGTDSVLVYDDKIPQVKTRIVTGLTSGFDSTVTNTQRTYASEGSGTGRSWDLLYKATQGQRKYSLDHTMDPVVEFPSPVDTTATYTSYTINHGNVAQIDTSNMSYSPQSTFVLIPSGESTLISAFDTLMNAWLTSATGFGIKSI